MGAIYKFLGLAVGVIVHELNDDQRREEYAADVTYGTNNEFGFDYLRDNMKYSTAEMVQRGHYYAIVDEVDSILIDEARTPLIISGPLDDRSELYNTIDKFIPKLDEDRLRARREAARRHPDRSRQRACRAAADRGRACSRATRSTTSRTSPSCTTCSRRCAPIRCSSATATTSSRTTR